MGFVQYLGSQVPYATSITAGNTRETVEVGQVGQVIHLDDLISAALLSAEPTLWQSVSGFPAPSSGITSPNGTIVIGGSALSPTLDVVGVLWLPT